MERKSTFDLIYDVVRQIPRGKVASYGQVAALAGNAHWARVVGYALHVNPDPDGIPCYRVVTMDGRPSSAFGAANPGLSGNSASSTVRSTCWKAG